MLRSVFSASILTASLAWCATAQAVLPPTETLLPNTTKGWVSVPNVDLLRDNFNLTQLGELAADPAMKPFMEDLGGQLEEKLSEAGVKLGIKLADLDGVYGGEVAIALLKPEAKDMNSHALALVVDITGKQKAAEGLLAKIDKNLAAKGAVKAFRKAGPVTIIAYTLPLKAGETAPATAFYAMHGDALVASDSEQILVGVLSRIGVKAKDSLANVEAFAAVSEKVHGKEDPLKSHLRWFVEPLGYAETVRATQGGKKKRGADPLVILRKQGFDAIQGAGGRLDFHTGDHELLHHTYVYAPPVAGAKGGLKYNKGANMLDFPNGENLTVQEMIHNDVATYITLNWRMQKAYKHFGGIFDAFMGEGTWEEIVAGLETDPAGPEINIEAELVAMMGERVTVVTDYKEPITPTSERVLAAFALTDKDPDAGKKAADAIRKLMKVEADARKIEVEGFEAWEISERKESAEIPDLQIDGPGFVAFEGQKEEGDAAAADEVVALAPADKPISWVITVAHDHLFVATHVDILSNVLKKKAPADQLQTAKDLSRVRTALEKLGSKEDSFRFFSRSDDALHPTFELIKAGKMPEAETMLARVLNQAFAPAKKGEVRKQEIDGRKLPAWGKVSGYFGPAGAFVQTEDKGWMIIGCLLANSAEGEPKKPEEVASDPK